MTLHELKGEVSFGGRPRHNRQAKRVKNVIRMPKERAKRVRARISYMSAEQLERFLQAAKEYGLKTRGLASFDPFS
jgi:hypothetical protein